MKTTGNLKASGNALFKNIKQIILYFEDQIEPGKTWIKKGNLMFMKSKNEELVVRYDKNIFVPI